MIASDLNSAYLWSDALMESMDAYICGTTVHASAGGVLNSTRSDHLGTSFSLTEYTLVHLSNLEVGLKTMGASSKLHTCVMPQCGVDEEGIRIKSVCKRVVLGCGLKIWAT